MVIQRLFFAVFLLFMSVCSFAEQFHILGASYGTDYRNMDVTEQLKRLASQERTVKVTNSLFGNDPDPGKTKMLRIYARAENGQTRTFEYKEGRYIDGSQFSGWGSGNWAGGYRGGWNGDGHQQQNQSEGGYVILQASYGTRDRNVDVTHRLRQLAQENRSFKMGNATFGVDPDPGRTKMLRVYARGPNGDNRTFDYKENSYVDGSVFAGWGGGNWGHGGWKGGWGDDGKPGRGHGNGQGRDNGRGNLNIVSATYGEGGRVVDVTNRLRQQVRDGRLDTRASNQLAGRDPSPGRNKYLTITYKRGGQREVVTIPEGQQVSLP